MIRDERHACSGGATHNERMRCRWEKGEVVVECRWEEEEAVVGCRWEEGRQ